MKLASVFFGPVCRRRSSVEFPLTPDPCPLTLSLAALFFELAYLLQPQRVASAFNWLRKPGLQHFCCETLAYYPAAQHEHIGIHMASALYRSKQVMDQGRPHTSYLVGGGRH